MLWKRVEYVRESHVRGREVGEIVRSEELICLFVGLCRTCWKEDWEDWEGKIVK